MQYYVTRTGLDVFDSARVWGLAVLLNALTEDEVILRDEEWAYVVEPVGSLPENPSLADNLAWRTLFSEQEWRYVFITDKGGWSKKRDRVGKVLERSTNLLLKTLQDPTNTVSLGSGSSLPGGLDPTAFKGLRHATRARYGEDQLKVPEEHWALACLGMATCGTYRYAKEAGQSSWLVLLPVPGEVRFSYFRDVQDLLRPSGLRYHGIQNAAAHYAVQLAEGLRRRAAAQGSLRDRFSAVLYFCLFSAGQQTKPAQGNQVRLEPLMEAIARDPHGTQPMLEWLEYCFRLGSTRGAEDLALAVTELVMRWDLDAYERLVRTLIRYQAQGRVKHANFPERNTLEEVISHVRA